MRDAGKSFDELYDWAKANRTRVHHQFFSTTLSYYRRSGRVSGPASLIGNMLKLCPLLRLDKTGKIIAYSKVMSVSKAITKTVAETEAHVENGHEYDGKMWIAHSDCKTTAEAVTKQLKAAFPKADIRLFEIGPVIGSHCGRGTVAVYFMGDERAGYLQPQFTQSFGVGVGRNCRNMHLTAAKLGQLFERKPRHRVDGG